METIKIIFGCLPKGYEYFLRSADNAKMEEFNQSMPYILLNVYYGKNTHLKYSIAARYLEQSAVHYL